MPRGTVVVETTNRCDLPMKGCLPMPDEIFLLGGSAVAAITALGYLGLVGAVSLVAAAHKDPKRRADARQVLHTLLRARRQR